MIEPPQGTWALMTMPGLPEPDGQDAPVSRPSTTGR